MAIQKIENLTMPFPLGILKPGASYATVSISVLKNFTSGLFATGGIERTFFGLLQITAADDNTGVIYICNSAAGPDTTNYSNVLGIVLKGTTWSLGKEWANSVDLNHIYIGAENANDFSFGCVADAP